jgi:hypothetical protein
MEVVMPLLEVLILLAQMASEEDTEDPLNTITGAAVEVVLLGILVMEAKVHQEITKMDLMDQVAAEEAEQVKQEVALNLMGVAESAFMVLVVVVLEDLEAAQQ